MNAGEGADTPVLKGDHSPDVIEALAWYGVARGTEQGLEKAMHSIVRQLADARLRTHEAWEAVQQALAEEPVMGEGWGS